MALKTSSATRIAGYSGWSNPRMPFDVWLTKELSMVGRLMTIACCKSNKIKDFKPELVSITFFEIFRPTSLRVSEANGTGDNTEPYKGLNDYCDYDYGVSHR